MMSYLLIITSDNIEFVDANQNELIDKDNNVYLDFFVRYRCDKSGF